MKHPIALAFVLFNVLTLILTALLARNDDIDHGGAFMAVVLMFITAVVDAIGIAVWFMHWLVKG